MILNPPQIQVWHSREKDELHGLGSIWYADNYQYFDGCLLCSLVVFK